MLEDLITQIQRHLLEYHEEAAWKDFIDRQSLGDCQFITGVVFDDFKRQGVKRVFGEIEIDVPYEDKYGEEQNLVTHHWNTVWGKILDFSKGTLVGYIDWEDLYEVGDDTDAWRYQH